MRPSTIEKSLFVAFFSAFLSLTSLTAMGQEKWVVVRSSDGAVKLLDVDGSTDGVEKLKIPSTLRAEDIASMTTYSSDEEIAPEEGREYRVEDASFRRVFPNCRTVVLSNQIPEEFFDCLLGDPSFFDAFPALGAFEVEGTPSPESPAALETIDGVLFVKILVGESDWVRAGARLLVKCPPTLAPEEYVVSDSTICVLPYAFRGCDSLKKVVLPKSLNIIGASAFADCVSLSEINFPEGLKRVDDAAFWGCSSLTGEIVFPKSLERVGNGAFCKAPVKGFVVPDDGEDLKTVGGVLFSKDMKRLICYPRGGAKEYVVPETVETIEYRAFADCVALKKVALPKGLKKIGPLAFAACEALAGELALPDGVTEIGDGAFWRCKSLTGALVVPEGVETIANQAFSGCSFGSVKLPSGLKKIEGSAFNVCRSLSGELVIPDGVEEIGTTAFAGCEKLTKLVLPQELKTLGEKAFLQCSSLQGEITIPAGLAVVPEFAFEKCSSIASVVLQEGLTQIQESAFQGCVSVAGELRLPKSLRYVGNCAFRYSPFESYVVEDGNEAFETVDGVLFMKGREKLLSYPIGRAAREYSVPEEVKWIAPGAFSDCLALETVAFPNGLEVIHDTAFMGCKSLKGKITLPTGLVKFGFGPGAFCATQVEEFEISEENPWYKTIDGVLFETENESAGLGLVAYPGGRQAKEYVAPENAVFVRSRAFADCQYIEKLVFANVDSFYDLAAAACPALKEVEFKDKLLMIGQFAFWRDEALEKVSLPDSLKAIAFGAFSNCAALSEISVPADAYIVSNAFEGTKVEEPVRRPVE